MNMDSGTIFLLIIGIILTVGGGRIVFSKKGLDEMYEKGFWKKKVDSLDEKNSRQFHRYIQGGGMFLIGLILVVGVIITFFL